jgi:hypothetical protein
MLKRSNKRLQPSVCLIFSARDYAKSKRPKTLFYRINARSCVHTQHEEKKIGINFIESEGAQEECKQWILVLTMVLKDRTAM